MHGGKGVGFRRSSPLSHASRAGAIRGFQPAAAAKRPEHRLLACRRECTGRQPCLQYGQVRSLPRTVSPSPPPSRPSAYFDSSSFRPGAALSAGLFTFGSHLASSAFLETNSVEAARLVHSLGSFVSS